MGPNSVTQKLILKKKKNTRQEKKHVKFNLACKYLLGSKSPDKQKLGAFMFFRISKSSMAAKVVLC